MRQFDQAAVQAFLREAAASGEPRRELTASDGSRLVFERDPSPGVAESLTEIAPDRTEHVHLRTFAAAAARPAGYPAGAPFVAGHRVSVSHPGGEGAYILSWEGVDDAGALAAELMDASVAEGWVRSDAQGGPLGRAAVRALGALLSGLAGASLPVILRRSGWQRLLTIGGPGGGRASVSLSEVLERAEASATVPGIG